jgi:hypothetical protein
MTKAKIALGAQVKDVITGFVGVVTGRCEWITGCIQYVVAPQKLNKETSAPVPGEWFDEQRLKVLKTKTVGLQVGSPDGGPHSYPKRQSMPTTQRR